MKAVVYQGADDLRVLGTCFRAARRGGRVSIFGAIPCDYKLGLTGRFFDMFTLTAASAGAGYFEG